MSLELILDIVLSVVVLVIYHSDCDRTTPAPVEPIAEVHVTSPEQYDHTIIPSSVPELIDEWAIEDEALIMSHPGEVQAEIESVHFNKPIEIDDAYMAYIDYTAAWYAEVDALIDSDDPSLDGPIEVAPLTPEAIAACTSLSTDPIGALPLAEYQAMSLRKLKALGKELSIPKYSRMKQEALAVAVHKATIDRDGYPDDF